MKTEPQTEPVCRHCGKTPDEHQRVGLRCFLGSREFFELPEPQTEQTHTAEPLPCPFCGKTKHLEVLQETPTAYFEVYCLRCHMDAPTREGAIAAWNKRAGLTAPEDALRKAREALEPFANIVCEDDEALVDRPAFITGAHIKAVRAAIAALTPGGSR